ncbi:MAG: bifunctional 5,10-methylenetetrahydrofolate dehydrogenase/5,10-methenyltetrahydrofolate cyclohydrolase [Patescibacteria group bacterium]
MSAKLLSGKIAREALVKELISKVQSLSNKPNLAIIQVGDREDSASYIRAKKNFAEKIGVDVLHTQVQSDVTQEKLVELIKGFNDDNNVNGIIVQLPISEHLDKITIIDAIDPKKDVDGLTAFQIEAWSNHKAGAILPATARGVKELLKYYDINLSGKKVVVIGRSDMVGRPIAVMCKDSGAVVTVCHSKTVALAKETKKVDIIIVAVGKPKLIGADHVKAGQIIIDVGLNTVYGEKLEDEIENKKLVGDVDFEGVKEIVFAITPVPGGVGPMTVFALFENLIDVSSAG